MDDATRIVDAPNKSPRRYRWLRIAASVFFGVLTVAVLVLWVRSYWRVESVQHVSSGKIALCVVSVHGVLQWNFVNYSRLSRPVIVYDSLFQSVPIQPRLLRLAPLEWHFDATRSFVRMPHWFLVIGCTMLGVAPWLSWRYSLRTMLIATTFAAVVLGLFVHDFR